MIYIPNSKLKVTTISDMQEEIILAIRELGPLNYLVEVDNRLTEEGRCLARRHNRSHTRLPAFLLFAGTDPLPF